LGGEVQAHRKFDGRYQIPAYTRPNGWVTSDVEEDINWGEVRALLLDSHRHFALQRMLKELAE
jgi:hypothetical protein